VDPVESMFRQVGMLGKAGLACLIDAATTACVAACVPPDMH
jgi:hypothetical protein